MLFIRLAVNPMQEVTGSKNNTKMLGVEKNGRDVRVNTRLTKPIENGESNPGSFKFFDYLFLPA